VNESFEELARKKRKDIIGKSLKDVFPGIDNSEFDWLGTLSRVVITGKKAELNQYLESLGRWLSVLVYSSEKDCLVTIFSDITEYRTAQETIQRQRDFLEKVKESLTHPLYVIDVDSYIITMANTASGFGVFENGSTCYGLTHQREVPCDSLNHPCPLQEVRTTKQSVIVNHIHTDAAGNSRFVEIHAYPIIDGNGEVTEIIEYALDTTERHNVEDALRESEKQHRTLIQSINDLIFVIDCENRLSQFYSSNSGLLFGPSKDLLGRSVSDVLPPEVAQQLISRSRIVRTRRTRQDVEYLLGLGNDQRWFLATLDLHEDGESIVVVVRDITKRKRVEDALRRSETSLAEAQKIAHLGNWDWDIARNELHWSDEVYNIFGVTQQEFSGSHEEFLELVHPNDRDMVRLSVDKALTELESYSVEYRIIQPDGSERVVHEQSEVHLDGNGNATRIIGTVLDITERKIIEKELQLASKRAILYIDLMGHDVSNQLQIVLSCNALLKERALTPDVGYLMELIDDSISECHRIVSKAKSTENLPQFPLTVRDRRAVLIDCIRVIEEDDEDIDIETTFVVDKAPILADEFLEYLIDNILENAVVHNPSQEKRIWIIMKQRNHGYEVSISDNGTGINKQMKKDLFNLTRRFGGMGLHQVKEILEKYKGRISVTDRVSGFPEYGARFQIWIPEAPDILRTKADLSR